MRSYLKRFRLSLFGLVSLSFISLMTGVTLALAFAQTHAQTGTPTQQATPLPLEQLRLFSEVFGQIKRDYVQPVGDEKLLDAAIKGMASSLDPHSSYLGPQEFKELQEQTKGKFAGLGIEISQEDGLVKVIAPIEDTPAFRAGLHPGDLITQIGDEPVRGLALDEAVKLMRGKPGTQVVLLIFRKSEGRTFPITITRAEIRVQSVKTKIVEPGYLWLRITSFQENTVADLARKLNEIFKNQTALKGIVLDLRNNGGGILQSAIGVSAAFLPPDTTVVSTNGQIEEAKQLYQANFENYRLKQKEKDPLRNFPEISKTVPIIVLVNAYSASASEIVAGALQDQKRALVMGKTTFGKGSVQTVRQLSPDTALRLTTAYYYTPSGRSIQSIGIHPDLFVDQNEQGDLDDVLITREIDIQNHLKNTQNPDEQEAIKRREKQRLEALQRLEAENLKKTPEQREEERQKKFPEFGSNDDFMLKQALNQFKALPVILSKSYNIENASNKNSKKPKSLSQKNSN